MVDGHIKGVSLGVTVNQKSPKNPTLFLFFFLSLHVIPVRKLVAVVVVVLTSYSFGLVSSFLDVVLAEGLLHLGTVPSTCQRPPSGFGRHQ